MEAAMWASVNGAIMVEAISFCCSFYGAHLICEFCSYYIIGDRKKTQPEMSWCQDESEEWQKAVLVWICSAQYSVFKQWITLSFLSPVWFILHVLFPFVLFSWLTSAGRGSLTSIYHSCGDSETKNLHKWDICHLCNHALPCQSLFLVANTSELGGGENRKQHNIKSQSGTGGLATNKRHRRIFT